MPSHVVSNHSTRPANLSQVDVTLQFLRPFERFKEEALDYDAMVGLEIRLWSYVALEVLSFIIKRHLIYKEFGIDLLKLLQFSLTKNGISYGCGIVAIFVTTMLTGDFKHFN